MAENLKLSLDTGSVLIDIDDKGEIIGSFRFNPNDIDILRRYETVSEFLEGVSIGDNPTPEEILKLSDDIKAQMNYLLNYNVSDDIFAKCNPFTITADGSFFIEQVLDGITQIIEQVTKQRVKTKTAKIKKATAKYTKSANPSK